MTRSVVRLVLAAAVAVAAWLVTLSTSPVSVVAPVLQEALPIAEPDFSLDARFVTPVAYEPVYVLEQRAAPMHRVARIDPASGAQETIWTVPEGSLVHALSLSPDGGSLAMAVTDDYADPGNDLVLVDLATGLMTEVWTSDSADHLTDLVWDLDGGVVWATRIRGDVDGPAGLSVVAIGVATGVVVDEIPMAVQPAPLPGGVAVLDVDPSDGSRRSVTVAGSDGSITIEATPDGRELDHLVYDPLGGRLFVAALSESGRGIGIGLGAVAEASTAPIRSSQWLEIGLAGETHRVQRIDVPETVVYDASITVDGALAIVTQDGLILLPVDSGAEGPVQVMASRAYRKVAA